MKYKFYLKTVEIYIYIYKTDCKYIYYKYIQASYYEE